MEVLEQPAGGLLTINNPKDCGVAQPKSEVDPEAPGPCSHPKC